MRTMSPPRRMGTRGMSVGPAVTRNPTRSVSGRANGLGTVHELERSASRNSINFSYPMNSRPNSPSLPPSPQHRRQVPTSLAEQLSSPESPAHKPVRTATKSVASKRQSTGAQSQVGTAVAAAQAAIVPGATGTREQAPAPSRPVMIKRPSTVPEDHQGEERAEAGANNVYRVGMEEQDRNPATRGPVTPEPQITKSPPTPERSNSPPPFNQIASPASNRSVELDREPGKQSRVRQPSASPGRSARFSTQLSVVGADELHHPPPRSVSPVKSAMKHSSQGSLSPDRAAGGIIFRPAPPPSELSDGTSVGSDEGYRVRRKPVKVSFDDEAEIVGVAASPPTSPEDMLPPESPPGRSKSKTTLFGLGKKRLTTLGNAGVSDEFEEVLKPRPALPSFGSIRAMRDTGSEFPQPTRDEPSDDESIASSTSNMVVPGWSFSNDHALGGILANAQPENAMKLTEKIEHPPLPAKTSENGNPVDEVSEFVLEIRPAWVDGMQAAEFVPKPKQQDPVPAAITAPTSIAAVDTNLAPAVNVEPSSPDTEKGRSSLEGYDVPGGFPRTSLEFIDPKTAAGVTTPAPPTPAPGKEKVKKKSHNRSGSGSSVILDESGTPIPARKGTDDDSDGSVYSDAAEEFEGDGFGSINAIVDNGRAAEQTDQPMTGAVDKARPAGAELPSVPEEPQQMIGRAVSPPQDSLPWVPDSPDTVDEPLPFSSPYPPFPIKRKPTNKPRPVSGGVVTRSNTTANRAQRPVSSVSFTPETTNGVPRPRPGSEGKRPVSLGPVLTNGKGAGLETGAQRPMTGTSDSSGSFQRPGAGSPNGRGHTMRRTMRAHSQEPPKVQFSPSRQELPEERRPISSGSMAGRMPTTLRGTGPNKSGKTSFFSTGRSLNRKKLSRAPGALFSSPSRFEDSDGEEDEGPMQTFRSRFADSSDEDEPGPNTLRPVRGIPRRHGVQDGESTELEDSSDEERRRPGSSATAPAWNLSSPGPADATGMAAVARSRGVSREELEDFLHQPSRKSGIFSKLNLRKGRKPEPKHRKMSSEPVSENSAVHQRGGSVTTTVTANNSDTQATDIKGQRRGSRLFNMGDGWPLRNDRKSVCEADGGAGADAITTASGAVPLPEEQPQVNGSGGNRGTPGAELNEAAGPGGQPAIGEGSHFHKRQNMLARDVVIAGSVRKKRFPKLRKAFGLRN